ncbi:MAG: hypothetical protein ACI9H8_002384 [Lysobacterales bacterium]|jgi:hypothetical protein
MVLAVNSFAMAKSFAMALALQAHHRSYASIYTSARREFIRDG